MILSKGQKECIIGMARWGHPVTGSRLSRILDKRFSDWAGPKLIRLLSAGLVAIHDERAGQKYYALTEAGKQKAAES